MAIIAETTPLDKSPAAVSILNHIKDNRVEYMLGVAVLHLLGVSDKVIGALSGVCM